MRPLLLFLLRLFLHAACWGILWIPLNALHGQSLAPDLKTFTGMDYDGHGQILSVHRDTASGRVYIGTAGEVLIHDGKGFDKVRIGSGIGIFSMDMDEDGKLWLGGTNAFGVIEPDHRGKPRYRSLRDSLKESMPDSLVDPITIWNTHAIGNKVFFNGRKRIFVHDRESKETELIEPWKDRFYTSSPFQGKEGKELIVQELDSGLVRIDPVRLEREFIPGSDSFRTRSIQGIHSISGSGNHLIMPTLEQGVFMFSPETGSSKPVSMPDEMAASLRQERIYTSAAGPRNSLILGTYYGGVRVQWMEEDRVRREERVTDSDGLGAGQIWDLAAPQHPGEALWVGTDNGLSVLNPYAPLRSFSLNEGLTDLLRAGPQETLFLTSSKGLRVLGNASSSARDRIGPGMKEKELLLEGLSLNMSFLPRTGRVAVASDHLYLLDPEPPYPVEQVMIEGLSPYDVEAIEGAEDRTGDLLALGGRSGIRILQVTPQKVQELFHFWELDGEVVALESIALDEGTEEAKYLIVASLRTQGVLCLALDRDLGVLKKAFLPSEEQLPEGNIEVYEAPESPWLPEQVRRKEATEFLLGTDQGLMKLHAGNLLGLSEGEDTISHSSSALEGLDPDKRIASFQQGNKRELWALVDGYPYRWSFPKKAEGKVRVDSLPFKGLKLGVIQDIYPDSDSKTWILGDYGISLYDAEKQWTEWPERKCLIEEVRIQRGETDSLLFGGYSLRKDSGSSLQSPSLPYEMNNIIFHFISPMAFEREGLRYRWKLEGYDSGWVDMKQEEKATYTNLPEGSYRFLVQAQDVYGKRSKTTEFGFSVHPPWYRTYLAYSGYGVLSILFVWFIAWLNARRSELQRKRLERVVRERTAEIKKRKDEVEEAHKEINDSIRYARKIQRALLQSEEYLSTHLPEHFVLFKPQAEVSGDFYWAKEHAGHLYFAAVDCTGHGVPGAFMSMLGVAFLGDIFSDEEELDPGEVLDRLRDRVIHELSTVDAASATKDGMDVALVKIPIPKAKSQIPKEELAVGNGQLANVEVEFAGAQNPLYVVRKGVGEDPPSASMEYHGEEGEDRIASDRDPAPVKPFKKSPDGVEVKGDSQPVGYDEHAKGSFTTVKLEVQKGDMLYIFSDGYADQFGGPKGKKFRYGPFKELLTSIHEKPLKEQKQELDKTFEDWKEESDQEQIDDVLVIGLRV